ncbi:DUF3486 family protein [Salmonella enterica]|uniref:DUF3486 family protein n=1 Tax=Salmonella typhimurium (strain SL1344) TaxID=216597 RepID=A0A718XW69_SALTS|nr:DUF3486 family protein [Salmonella enterica]EAA4604662.1 DUF3486 family protein [Salmonella enterica subsp. enterica serovar Kisangani]EBV5175655.1 DUF3486 family protein [Salmonella enterica subsp. enterica serovar Carmel]ECA7285220.1 DUF3486 family protein [Salmonella enterica subsp. enterica serovar Schwarzengrund]ECD3765271.1 DUF3486 family protein [Salmonella enterica subsp. enterica serovar Onderstepoort]ECN7768788.1 DUF3486 family protein [Salmonella enterica subsp. enterica serovar 
MENEQRPTRGRLSKVDLLPDSIREQLHQMLREKRHTQEEIREAINALIDEHNLPEDMQLSRTGLNRYASRMEKVGAKIRASREMAEAWAARLGAAPTSDVGKLLMEFVKTLAFETSMSMAEEDKPIAPKALGQLALVAQRLEAAAMTSHKREKAIRDAFAQEMAEKTEELVRTGGLSGGAADTIKRELLGISA